MTSFTNLLSIIFISIVGLNSVVACSCEPYIPEFCNIVNTDHFIVRAVVTGHPEYHLMEIDIMENLHQDLGETSTTILGQDGVNCGENLEYFEIGSELILALNQTVDWQSGELHWYLEGACGLHHLSLNGNTVEGQITETLVEQNFQDFKEGLLECLSFDVSTTETLEQSAIEVFPNPVLSVLNIQSENHKVSEVEIYDANGQLVFKKNFLENNSTSLNSQFIHPGIYFIRIRTRKGIWTKRFLKM